MAMGEAKKSTGEEALSSIKTDVLILNASTMVIAETSRLLDSLSHCFPYFRLKTGNRCFYYSLAPSLEL